MQLSINNWPPLASHMACFLGGIILANLSSSTVMLQRTLPKDMIAVPVHKELLYTKFEQLRAGARLIKVNASAERNAPCFTAKTPYILLQTTPFFVIGVPATKIDEAKELRSRRGSFLQDQLVPEDEGIRMRPCNKVPRVHYAPAR